MRLVKLMIFGRALGQFLDEGKEGRPTLDVSKYVPVVRNQKELEEAEARIAQAEMDVASGGNHTSRIVFVAGVVTILASIFSQGEGDFSCKSCQTGIAAAARTSRLPGTRKMILFALKKLCEKVGGKSDAICHGVAESTGAVLYDVLNEMDLDNVHVRQVSCYALGNACPMPEIPARPQWFPPPRENAFERAKVQEFKYILQLSDLHFDDSYVVGAEADCNRPLCCQKDSNDDSTDKTIKRPAGKWGDFKCDLNKNMLASLLNAAKQVGKTTPFDMVLFTGDIPAHDMWKEEKERGKRTAAGAFKALDQALGDRPIYPVIGNHEPVPINQFPIDGKIGSKDFYLYHFLADQWKKWLPGSAISTIHKGGYYSVKHDDNLKVITLNNNLCYTYNFHLLLDPSNPDPNGILHWLANELQDAEDNLMRVIISGHVPPGSKECYQHWSDRHYRIIQRYHHLISAQFYGHEHFDEFQIFYSEEEKTRETAISHAFVAPSMTTFDGHNPGFRVYKVDAETYQPIDYTQYYADMTVPGAWDASHVDWKVLYTARGTYGPGILRDVTRPTVLHPQFWHRVTQNLESNFALFNTFYQLRTKNSYLQPDCLTRECQDRFVCSLRAGKSRDNCNVPVPFT